MKTYQAAPRDQWCITDVERVDDMRWQHTCVKCRRVIVVGAPRMSRRCPEYDRGLGSRLAAMLKLCGVTPARISKLIGKPCGCAKRREWLDRLDFALRRKLKRRRMPPNGLPRPGA